MARMMMDDGAIPMSYYSPAAPYAVPAHQAPCYVIPQPAHSIPHYSGAPYYVYSPSSASEYGQSHGAPIFKVVPSQNVHQHQYPLHNVVPMDHTSKKEVTLQEALENALRQQKQPKAQMVQQIPQALVAPNARHPVYVIPEATMLGQPVHYNGYPVYRAEDVTDDVNRSHLPLGALGNQQPGGVQYVNSHGVPITAPVSESQPYGLPAAQPGMRWKLVPVADSDQEETRGATPTVSPKAASAPVMRLKSSDAADRANSDINHRPDSALEGDNVVSAQTDDPYKQFLSLLFPKLEDRVQTNYSGDPEGKSTVAPSISTAKSLVPEVEVKATTTPKSVRIIPVTNAPKDEKQAVAVMDAPREEKTVFLEGKGSLKEKDCSGADAKARPSSVTKQPDKSSTPTLKPIRLVPSLDFVKKKESKPVAGSKQEEQVTPQKTQGKADSHQASAENSVREEVIADKNGEKEVLAANTPDEAGPKTEAVAKRAREKSVEGSSDVGSHTVPLEKCDEPSAKKKRLITDSETAARLIQSAYRGYVVRRCQPLKHLRDIARVKSMLKEYQALAADRSSLLEKCKDPAERTKISEGIMSLLLQLDVIQGVDPVVREIRKYTSKEVLKLQSEVDAAMALVVVSPQVVSKGLDQVTPLGVVDDGTLSVDKNVAASEKPKSAETNVSVERPHHTATDGAEALVSKSEDVAENQPTGARPEVQPEEQVEALLWKLLNKLPKSGGCEGAEAIDAGELTDDSALISEVVKRLSFLREQQRDKDTDTRCLNNHQFSAGSARGHIEKQEESTLSDIRASENSSDEVFPSISGAREGPSQIGMADVAAGDSFFEPTTSRVELVKSWQRSAPGGEGSHAALDDGGERGENKVLPVSEPESSPTELELRNLAETVAADFVDVVLTHSEDTISSVQSSADNKENILEGQDILESHDTTLHEGCDDKNGLPPQSASVVSHGMAEAPQRVNVESKLTGTSHLTSTEIAGGETQTETSVKNCGMVDGKDTSGVFKASGVDNDGEGPHRGCRSECTTDIQGNDSRDGPMFGSGEILHQNVTGDVKERASELGPHEECSCKESIMASAYEVAINSDSATSLADEEEVENSDLNALQQFALTGTACDSLTQASLPPHDENNVNGDTVEVKVESVNALEEALPLCSGDCCKAGSSRRLWNGLDETCHDSPDVQSSTKSIAQVSEEVAPGSTYPGIHEPCNFQQQSRSGNASDESVIPENPDVVERTKLQIPNKSFPSQEDSAIEADSPTSVLDAAISMAPGEDVFSEDIAEISLDDTTSEPPPIQVVTMDDPEGTKMQQSIRDSSMNEEEALQLQSAISDLELLNGEGEFFLNDESLQLESAISDLHSLNNSGQGFLNDLNPEEDRGAAADSMVRCPSLKRITEDVYLPKPPSLSPEARRVLESGFSLQDVCERPCPSSASSPSSDTELTLTQHLIEENTVLKELVKDILKWSEWQSSATLSLHKMMEKLALEVLEAKTTAKRAVKCKQGRNKIAAKKKHKLRASPCSYSSYGSIPSRAV